MNAFKLMTVLADSQIEKIRTATENLLHTTGFAVQNAALLAAFRKAGADVDEPASRVHIPPPLCRELLAAIPSAYTARNVLGECHRIGIGAEPVGWAIVTDPWIIDYATAAPRRPRLDDIRRHTIIAQRLDAIVGVSRMEHPVEDVPDATSSLRALEVHLLHQARHNLFMAATLDGLDQWVRIGRILARDGDLEGLLTSAVAVTSPLTLSGLNVELLDRSVRHGFTVVPTVCPMAGSTSPYSLAGTLLQANAEAILVALAAQVIRRGAPFLYGLGPSVTDMCTGYDLYYTLDKVLWKIAAVQLAHAYNLPVTAECGGSLTWRYDPQCGAEGMLFMMAAFASGADLLAGFGSFHNAVGMSAEMMIIQDAYLKAAQQLARGITTDDLHLAVKNIHNAGPGGNFLADDLTLALLRSREFFHSDIFDFGGGHAPSKSMLERAHDRVEELIANFVSPVPDDIQENLKRYFHDQYAAMV